MITTGKKASYDLNLENKIILLKCPLESYKRTSSDSFSIENRLLDDGKIIHEDGKSYSWCIYTSKEIVDNDDEVQFGKLTTTLRSNNDPYQWMVKFKYNTEFPHPRYMNLSMDDINKGNLNRCGTNLVVINRDSNAEKISGFKGFNFYHNQPIYDFKLDSQTNLILACGAWKFKSKLPSIYLPEFISETDTNKIMITNNNANIMVIKKDISNANIKVSLKEMDSCKYECKYEHFDESEKIKATTMIFNKNNTFKELKLGSIRNYHFIMKKFGTKKFTYKCKDCIGEVKESELIVFFKPHDYDSTEFVKKYFDRDINSQPECDLENNNLGYLIHMSIRGTIFDVTKLSASHGPDMKDFNITDESIKYIKYPKVESYSCIYMTPVGKYSVDFGVKITTPTPIPRTPNPTRARVEKQNMSNNQTVFLFVLLILLFLLGILVIKVVKLKKEKINAYLIERKIKTNYPNVWSWWNRMSGGKLKDNLKTITKESELPSKYNMSTEMNAIDGGKITPDSSSIYSEFLVKSQKKFKIILAYEVYHSDTFNGIILSQPPYNEKLTEFWRMIFEESINIIIPINFSDDGTSEESNLIYWPPKQEVYNGIIVEYVKTFYSTMKNITGLIYKLTRGKKSSTVTIYCIKGWKLYEIPKSLDDLIQLYDEISKLTPKNKTLIHSSYGCDSPLYYYTYFCAIVDTFFSDKDECNPMKVVKSIRKKRYGGKLSSLEYAYVFNAVAKYFISKKVILDVDGYEEFNKKYDNYLYSKTKVDCKKIPSLRNFIYFINILDEIKMEEICNQVLDEYVLNVDILKDKCQKFMKALQYEKLMKDNVVFNKYPYLYCLDDHSVSGGSFNIYGTDVVGYINANEITYNSKDGSQRKIVMCQAPTSGTKYGVMDMFFEQDIDAVAILLNDNEIDGKVMPYLSTTTPQCYINDFHVTIVKVQNIKDMMKVIHYKIVKGEKDEINLRFYVYKDWSKKDIPNDILSFHSFFKHIIEEKENKNIVIQCDSGVNRSGILGYLIYTIDNISENHTFNLIKNLGILRRHRYGIITTPEQLLFVLKLIIIHYKSHIDNIDQNLCPNVVKVIQNYEKQREEQVITVKKVKNKK
uniref:Protein-tyrosine-phosphatase n=1 Tax=Strongyloides papillosus TaxID=174720 RepID=A0A0N5BKI2_STREA